MASAEHFDSFPMHFEISELNNIGMLPKQEWAEDDEFMKDNAPISLQPNYLVNSFKSNGLDSPHLTCVNEGPTPIEVVSLPFYNAVGYAPYHDGVVDANVIDTTNLSTSSKPLSVGSHNSVSAIPSPNQNSSFEFPSPATVKHTIVPHNFSYVDYSAQQSEYIQPSISQYSDRSTYIQGDVYVALDAPYNLHQQQQILQQQQKQLLILKQEQEQLLQSQQQQLQQQYSQMSQQQQPSPPRSNATSPSPDTPPQPLYTNNNNSTAVSSTTAAVNGGNLMTTRSASQTTTSSTTTTTTSSKRRKTTATSSTVSKRQLTALERCPSSGHSSDDEDSGSTGRSAKTAEMVANSDAVKAAAARAAELTPIYLPCNEGDDDSAVRKQRNKISASQYRKRRKVFVDLLEEKVAEMESALKQQQVVIQQLQSRLRSVSPQHQQQQQQSQQQQPQAYYSHHLQHQHGYEPIVDEERSVDAKWVVRSGVLFALFACVLLIALPPLYNTPDYTSLSRNSLAGHLGGPEFDIEINFDSEIESVRAFGRRLLSLDFDLNLSEVFNEWEQVPTAIADTQFQVAVNWSNVFIIGFLLLVGLVVGIVSTYSSWSFFGLCNRENEDESKDSKTKTHLNSNQPHSVHTNSLPPGTTPVKMVHYEAIDSPPPRSQSHQLHFLDSENSSVLENTSPKIGRRSVHEVATTDDSDIDDDLDTDIPSVPAVL